MAEIATERPVLTRRLRVDPLSQLTDTLAEHYKKKQARYTIEAPRTFDRDLLRIFSDDPRHRRSLAASTFIRQNRTELRQMVSRWTGEYQLTLDAVLDEMIARCRELNLRAAGPAGRAQADPRRDRRLEAERGLQSARGVSRRGDLRPERRELPRTAADSLYRLQSARPDAGARQGPRQEAPGLSPDSRAGVRRVPDAA